MIRTSLLMTCGAMAALMVSEMFRQPLPVVAQVMFAAVIGMACVAVALLSDGSR